MFKRRIDPIEEISRAMCIAAKVDPDRIIVVDRETMFVWESMKAQAAMLMAGVRVILKEYDYD